MQRSALCTAVTHHPAPINPITEEEFGLYFAATLSFLIDIYIRPAPGCLARALRESSETRVTKPASDRCKHGMTATWCQTCIETNNHDHLALKFRGVVHPRLADHARRADAGYKEEAEADKWSWLNKATKRELQEHSADKSFWDKCCALHFVSQADEPLFALSNLSKSYALRLATVKRVMLPGLRGPSHFRQIAKNLREYFAKAARTAKPQSAKMQTNGPIESLMVVLDRRGLLCGEHNGVGWEMSPARKQEVATMQYCEALRYAKAHRRWITERQMQRNGFISEFRSLPEIIEESRTYPK